MIRVYDDNELKVYIRAWLGMGLSGDRYCSNVYSMEYTLLLLSTTYTLPMRLYTDIEARLQLVATSSININFM